MCKTQNCYHTQVRALEQRQIKMGEMLKALWDVILKQNQLMSTLHRESEDYELTECVN